MNPANDLSLAILGKESPEAEELKLLASRYPWFGPLQVLAAQKAGIENAADYEKQIQTLSLHISNSLWLDHILNVNPEKQPVEKFAAHEDENEPQPAKDTETATIPLAPYAEGTLNAVIDTDITEVETPPVYAEQAIEQQPTHEEKMVEPEFTAEQEPPTTVEELVVQHPEEERAESIDEDDDEALANENGPELLIKIPGIKIEPLDPEKAELTFEPYHTVDYFASQGIKVKDEEKPKDRFSEQLKSFTEWLKTIRQVPVADVAVPPGSEEKKVERLAEISITDREVVTEAMAEVWEKQGDKAKAIGIYQKLSLLEPAKSSYFAAKIDHLKQF